MIWSKSWIWSISWISDPAWILASAHRLPTDLAKKWETNSKICTTDLLTSFWKAQIWNKNLQLQRKVNLIRKTWSRNLAKMRFWSISWVSDPAGDLVLIRWISRWPRGENIDFLKNLCHRSPNIVLKRSNPWYQPANSRGSWINKKNVTSIFRISLTFPIVAYRGPDGHSEAPRSKISICIVPKPLWRGLDGRTDLISH